MADTRTHKPRAQPPEKDEAVIRKAKELQPLMPKRGPQGSTGQTSKHDR